MFDARKPCVNSYPARIPVAVSNVPTLASWTAYYQGMAIHLHATGKSEDVRLTQTSDDRLVSVQPYTGTYDGYRGECKWSRNGVG